MGSSKKWLDRAGWAGLVIFGTAIGAGLLYMAAVYWSLGGAQ